MHIKQNVNRLITLRTWVDSFLGAHLLSLWMDAIAIAPTLPSLLTGLSCALVVSLADRTSLSLMSWYYWTTERCMYLYVSSTNTYSHVLNVFQQRDFIYLIWACKHWAFSFGKASMALRSFSAWLSQLQNNDRTWCSTLMLLQRNISKSKKKRVGRSLQIYPFNISVHSVHSDRREMCSKKSGCTFEPTGAGEASSTRRVSPRQSVMSFTVLILAQFSRWRGKCSSGGVSLSIWKAYGQPESVHYSSLFQLCTDLTCSCLDLTAWMQKPDRQERWIWWILELSHARLGGGAAGMMAAMTAGAWPWSLETSEFSSMSCFTASPSNDSVIERGLRLNGFESSLAPTAHICHKTLCAGFLDVRVRGLSVLPVQYSKEAQRMNLETHRGTVMVCLDSWKYEFQHYIFWWRQKLMASKGPPRWIAGSLFDIVGLISINIARSGSGVWDYTELPKRAPVPKESHSDPAMAGVSTAAMTLTAPSSLTWTCCNGRCGRSIRLVEHTRSCICSFTWLPYLFL